jgi:hypothetical protein
MAGSVTPRAGLAAMMPSRAAMSSADARTTWACRIRLADNPSAIIAEIQPCTSEKRSLFKGTRPSAGSMRESIRFR